MCKIQGAGKDRRSKSKISRHPNSTKRRNRVDLLPAEHDGQAFEHNLILLIVRDEPAFEQASQCLESVKLPPLVDLHLAGLVDLHRHAAAIPLARQAVDGRLISRTASRVFDGVEDVGEVRVQILLVLLGDAATTNLSKSRDGVLQLVLASPHGVPANHLRAMRDPLHLLDRSPRRLPRPLRLPPAQ